MIFLCLDSSHNTLGVEDEYFAPFTESKENGAKDGLSTPQLKPIKTLTRAGEGDGIFTTPN